MSLRTFSWTTPELTAKEILPALEKAIPRELIEQSIAESHSLEERRRRLPTSLVVALVIAMNIWSDDNIVDVLKNLVSGLEGQWIRLSQRWQVPSKSSISEARSRVGPQVMSRLFNRVAQPLAREDTPGAFLKGLRMMAVDGSTLDLPDTDENARVFGYPGSRRGTRAAFPKARLVVLVEAGTHLICDALLCPYRMGERRRVLKLLGSVGPGMLLMWDRGLHSFKMVHATLNQGAHYLGRVPANVKFEPVKHLDDGSYLSWINPDRKSRKNGATRIQVRVIEYQAEEEGQTKTYRLITDLMDTSVFPALLLATEYHQRWEVENTLDELKTHLNGRKVPIRSKHPRAVVQETYGWLLSHWAVRSLMFQAAQAANLPPLRLSFTGSLRVLRRAVGHFQSAQPHEVPLLPIGSSSKLAS